MKFPPLCSEESIREAKEAQRRERAAVTAATGLVITDDGRVMQKAGRSVRATQNTPDLTELGRSSQ